MPSKKSLYDLSFDKGLAINTYESYGFHYSNTLKLWRDEFLKKDVAVQGKAYMENETRVIGEY